MKKSKQNRKFPENLALITSLILTFLVVFRLLDFTLTAPKTTLGLDLTTENILKQVNSERALRNLPLLNTDLRLSQAAQSKSDDMQKRHYFSHTDPEGKYIWDKIVEAGYFPYSTLGENLAIDFFNTESLVTAWMNSPTHRQNILNDAFKDQGMGLTLGQANTQDYYSAITNTFGTLLAAKNNPVAGITEKTPSPTPPPVKVVENVKPKPGTPTSTKPTESLNVRETKAPSTTPEKVAVLENPAQSSEPPVLNTEKAVSPPEKNRYEKNRWLNVSFAAILAMLLLLDLKLLQKNGNFHLDKKINNIILVFLTIILTAFLYWM